MTQTLPEDKEKALSLLQNGYAIQLASVLDTNQTRVRTMHFIFKNNKIYVLTQKESAKIKQIEENNKIAFLLEDILEPQEEGESKPPLFQYRMVYLRGKGTIKIVRDETSATSLMNELIAKYPFLSEFPMKPQNMYVLEIEYSELRLFDNFKGFGHVVPISL